MIGLNLTRSHFVNKWTNYLRISQFEHIKSIVHWIEYMGTIVVFGNVCGIKDILTLLTIDNFNMQLHILNLGFSKYLKRRRFRRTITHLAVYISPEDYELWHPHNQSGSSTEVVTLFSATNFISYIIELLQLHHTIQIEWYYAWISYKIAIRSHLLI